jgi:hypothetical protein
MATKKDKNVHLEHIEDEIINRGVAGGRDAINFLRSLRDMLAGHAQRKVNVTTKWDGAPAIFCGINPDNGKFFVGTKSVFNANAKLNYTEKDIDINHPGEGLNDKLKIALTYLPKLGIKGVLQGDMMFTKNDLKRQQIQGEDYVTFQPNTIVYAVPSESKLAKTMLASQLGVVFHTSYTGSSMEEMRSSFNIDIGRLQMTKDVWFRDASFTDASGSATFTDTETRELTQILSQAGRIFQGINSMVLNRISASDVYSVYIKTFWNSKIREGKGVTNPMQHTKQMIQWIEDKLNKSIQEAKKEDTKQKRITEKNQVMRFFRNSSQDLTNIFTFMNLLIDAKLMVVRKLETIKSIGTFIRTDDGFKVTAPEGFVAVDSLKGNAVKLIDRLEFSQANFNATKNWSK